MGAKVSLPTAGMIEAGVAILFDVDDPTICADLVVREIWKAMVSALPPTLHQSLDPAAPLPSQPDQLPSP